MLAECPSCRKSFGVIGRGDVSCPFCSAQVSIEIVRPIRSVPTVVARLAVRDAVRTPSADGRRTPGQRPDLVSPPTPSTLFAIDAEAARQASDAAFQQARARARRAADRQTRRLTLRSVPWERASAGPIRWAHTVATILISPRRFFRRLTADYWGGASSFAAVQLAFALVAVLVRISIPTPVVIAGGEQAVQWAEVFNALCVAGVLAAVAASFFGAAVVWFKFAAEGAVERRVLWPGVGRVAAYGLAPLVFAPLPFAGPAVAIAWSVLLHAVGLRWMVGAPWATALQIAGVPWGLVLLALVFGVR